MAWPASRTGGTRGLIRNDITGLFSSGCFLRIRFGARNHPANPGRAYALVRRKVWAAGFVRITLPHQRMTKRHRGNRPLQDETAASSYIFTIPCNKRRGKTWRAFHRQWWMWLEVRGRQPWRQGEAMTECAWRLDLQVCADVCPNAETIANGVRRCLWVADCPGAIGATRRS